MNRYIYALAASLLLSLTAIAQETITGTVKNQRGTPIEGVAVRSASSAQNKVITDKNGLFELTANIGEYIELSYADSEGTKIWIENNNLNIVLSDKNIIVINRGQDQTSYRHTQAISTVSGAELSKNSTQNSTNILFGQLPGLTVTQNTGWTDNADFIIRGGGSFSGTSPLVVVDGIQREMNFINVDEIESISILKDGAATALWGTQGANGVVLVTTKRGAYNTSNIEINYQRGFGIPINLPNFADGYTFAQAKNEALYYDGLPAQYDAAALAAFQDGSNREIYSNTDWLKRGLRSHSINNQFSVALSGGNDKVRYYTLINYKNDYGILNENAVNNTDRYDAQMKKYEMSARVNLDVDMTKYTLISLSMYGLLREEKRPDRDEDDLFSSLYHVPSAAFPMKNSVGNWASNNIFKKNPIAELGDIGYYKNNQRLLQSDLKIIQNLSPLTEGLSAEFAISYDNSAVFKESAQRTYAYDVSSMTYNPGTTMNDIIRTTQGTDSALNYGQYGEKKSLESQFMRVVLAGNVSYNRAFGLHSVNSMLQYRQESYVPMGRNGSRYRQSIMMVGGYNYADKYLVDLVVNRSGTSVLSEGDKFRTYPAVSAAWVVSNENFINSSAIDYLKIRASWGRSGNDNMDYDLDKQFWVNEYGYFFGAANVGFGGTGESALAIRNLTCEISDKFNIGFDMQLFKNLSLSVDGFVDQRRKMLVDGDNVISSVIGVGVSKQNIGSMDTKGAEISLTWRENRSEFNYYIGGNFSYVKSKILENGEGYKPYDYLSKIGAGYGQMYGLEAIGYFSDVHDIENSSQQVFSDVRPGDIKYRDQNDDGIINDDDIVAIGNSSSVPGIYYGINLGFEYKGFGIDMVFQGLGQYSRMLNTQSVYWPLRNNNSNISTWYLEDKIRWTENTKETANVPRLTTMDNANNFRSSTQWLVDGSYLKLRNLNIYYNLPKRWIEPIGMEKLQIYLRGNNLFSIDSVDDMNSEDFAINYPDMTSVYVGININF